MTHEDKVQAVIDAVEIKIPADGPDMDRDPTRPKRSDAKPSRR